MGCVMVVGFAERTGEEGSTLELGAHLVYKVKGKGDLLAQSCPKITAASYLGIA